MLYFCFIHRSQSYCLSSIAIVKISVHYPLSLGTVWQQLSMGKCAYRVKGLSSLPSLFYCSVGSAQLLLMTTNTPLYVTVIQSETENFSSVVAESPFLLYHQQVGKKCVSHSWSLILLRQKLHVFLLLLFFFSFCCLFLP